MPVWAWLIGAVGLEVIGTTALQQSAQFTRTIPTLVMAVCYGLSFYALSVVVQSMPVGVMYAIWSGAGIALISLIGWVFLGQQLDTPAVIGIAMITSGVVVINMLGGRPHCRARNPRMPTSCPARSCSFRLRCGAGRAGFSFTASFPKTPAMRRVSLPPVVPGLRGSCGLHRRLGCGRADLGRCGGRRDRGGRHRRRAEPAVQSHRFWRGGRSAGCGTRLCWLSAAPSEGKVSARRYSQPSLAISLIASVASRHSGRRASLRPLSFLHAPVPGWRGIHDPAWAVPCFIDNFIGQYVVG